MSFTAGKQPAIEDQHGGFNSPFSFFLFNFACTRLNKNADVVALPFAGCRFKCANIEQPAVLNLLALL